MTPEQKKMLRDALLAALVATAPGTLPFAGLRAAARAMGFAALPDGELAREIDYLIKRGLATSAPDPISAAVTRYSATAAATDYCETEGLV